MFAIWAIEFYLTFFKYWIACLQYCCLVYFTVKLRIILKFTNLDCKISFETNWFGNSFTMLQGIVLKLITIQIQIVTFECLKLQNIISLHCFIQTQTVNKCKPIKRTWNHSGSLTREFVKQRLFVVKTDWMCSVSKWSFIV